LATDPSRFRISIVHQPWIWIPSPVPLGAFAARAAGEIAAAWAGCAAFASAVFGAGAAFDCAKLLAAKASATARRLTSTKPGPAIRETDSCVSFVFMLCLLCGFIRQVRYEMGLRMHWNS